MKKTIIACAVLATLAWAGSLGAHHSESMFEGTPVWVKGRFVDFARINPHSIITLEETTADGRVRRWAVEGGTVAQLERRGIGTDFLNAGDLIEVCGFPMKEEFSTPPPGEPPFVHGQVMVMPDGSMRIWGPYGKLRNCVRPDARSGAWADFLNSDSHARTAWCRQFERVPTREDSKAVIEEIGRLLAYPCE